MKGEKKTEDEAKKKLTNTHWTNASFYNFHGLKNFIYILSHTCLTQLLLNRVFLSFFSVVQRNNDENET